MSFESLPNRPNRPNLEKIQPGKTIVAFTDGDNKQDYGIVLRHFKRDNYYEIDIGEYLLHIAADKILYLVANEKRLNVGERVAFLNSRGEKETGYIHAIDYVVQVGEVRYLLRERDLLLANPETGLESNS